MIAKRLMWLLAVSSMVVVAGCGGKKAMDEPTEAAQPAPVEEVQEPAVEETKTPVQDLSPIALSDAFFAFDSYALSAEAKGTLEANAREMKRVTDKMISIEGHCDERGTKAYNLALGEKRANAARDYLVAMGVNASRISTVSYGKERPFDPGHDETAWAKNRRAHFVVK
jgi:peptidoglycan-associated lipoprotein